MAGRMQQQQRLGGAEADRDRERDEEAGSGTSTSLSSNSSSSASIAGLEAPTMPRTGSHDGGEDDDECVEMVVPGLSGRRRSVRISEGSDMDLEEGGTKGTASRLQVADSHEGRHSYINDSASEASMSPETAFHVNQRSIGGRKPATLQDIMTDGACVGGEDRGWWLEGWGGGATVLGRFDQVDR